MKYHLELDKYEYGNGSRKYIVGNRRYDSVTTVTGFYARKSIEQWKKRVGYKQAEKICKESSERGTEIHSLCENYFLNNLDHTKPLRDDSVFMFGCLKKWLENITEYYSIETCLYSDILRIAGRSDLIGEYEGIPSVVDFKSSRKPKKREWIDNYFAQLAIYSLAFKERTGIPLEQLVIMMVSLNGEVQIFKETISQWHYDNMYKYINEYRKHHP